MSARHWLLKTEPESFSITDLAESPKQTTYWDGVRNYQARNFMRDQMQVGDRVLFYHSNAEPPAVVGVAEVVSEAYPDHTAWDPTNHHYDPASTRENPVWQMIDVRFVEAFAEPLSLDLLRQAAGLEEMELLRKGSRLSVQPVSAEEFRIVLELAHGGLARPAAPARNPTKKKPVVNAVPKTRAARPAAKKVAAKSAGKLARPKSAKHGAGSKTITKKKLPKKSAAKPAAPEGRMPAGPVKAAKPKAAGSLGKKK